MLLAFKSCQIIQIFPYGKFSEMIYFAILLLFTYNCKIAFSIVFFENATIDEYITSAAYPDNENQLSILAIVNFNGSFKSGPMCTKALELGLEQAKLNGKLNGLNLKFDLINSQCDSEKMMRTVAHEMMEINVDGKKLPIMLIDECPTIANEFSPRILKSNNFVGFSTALKTSNFNYIKQMTTFSLLPESSLKKVADLNVLLHWGWQQYSVFSQDHPYFSEMEKSMFPMFENAGMQLVQVSKVNFQLPEHELAVDLERAVLALKKVDAMIIVANTDFVVPLSCWLYKLDMFRNRFIITSVWAMVNPDTVQIPGYLSSWCTRDMLKIVIKAWIFTDYGWMADIYGEDYKDSSNLTRNDFNAKMSEKVYEAEKFGTFATWAPACYDLAYYVSSVVGRLDKQLGRSNQSIFDWTIGSANFLNKGKDFQNLMLDVVFNETTNGQRFQNFFDKNTRRNSKGWTPVVYKQMLAIDGAKFKPVDVAYFRYSDFMVGDLNGGIRWLTDDGLQPSDRILNEKIQVEPNSTAMFAIFTVISIVVVIICISLLIEMHYRQQRYPGLDKTHHFLIISIIIMVSHVFAIPVSIGTNLAIGCGFAFFLFIIGLTATLTSVLVLTSGSNMSKTSLIKIITILTTQLIFIICFLSLVGIDTGTSVVSIAKSTDGRKEYEYFKTFCTISTNSDPAIGLLLAILMILIILMLLMAFSAYSIKAMFKVKRSSKLQDQAATSSYCQILIVIAGGLIISVNSKFQTICIVCPLVSFILAMLNIGFIELCRILKPNTLKPARAAKTKFTSGNRIESKVPRNVSQNSKP